MNRKDILTLLNENNEKEEYDIIAVFSKGKNKFVAYTEKSPVRKKNLLVLKITENRTISEVVEEDKAFVEEYLKRNVFGGD